jgi:hypothetical protein
VALDSDAPFLFQIHVIEDLRLHFALADGVGVFKQTIGKCTFTVVDVCDDAKIPDVLHDAFLLCFLLFAEKGSVFFGDANLLIIWQTPGFPALNEAICFLTPHTVTLHRILQDD